MRAKTMSPGGRLMRASRLFSLPKPLPEPQSSNLHIGDHKSPTMTRQYPQYQAITSPLASREKGDWGFKRPFPLKSTLTTSTPLIRVKQVDSIESVTDFASAADHALSLEKFQEMRIAMSIPKGKDTNNTFTTDTWHKSVFEEDLDFTQRRSGRKDDKRWKFKGPWLARMTEGEFIEYLEKKVRPKRAQFKSLLLYRLVKSYNDERAQSAMEQGNEAPEKIRVEDVTPEWYTEYVRSLRNDRAALYGMVSKFLDLAPLGQPVGILQTFLAGGENAAAESPYGKSGPPPSHPSAGISYLRTNSFMANHPLYGPQKQSTPTLARVVYPRQGPSPAKLGVGGFVADSPPGDNEFNNRHPARHRISSNRKMLTGISHLDTTTFGGAKAYVSPETATVDPSGRVVVQLREAEPEAQLIAKEAKGRGRVYDSSKQTKTQTKTEADPWRTSRVADELLGGGDAAAPEGDAVSSSRNYGLDGRE
ncbi:mitochondrial ribosomal subunit domain-containing [Fusarium sporotrichioides]|uniref:Mitochondrial ribosomal subunit domain-containing n=1 Tax=Fusarium sporotrichioides TaxID=5514 RepID=A0A395RTD0_FUSSP|nr:mitochondrial ribosomal subunit domain-containing [Fusarium sporotrichioides]